MVKVVLFDGWINKDTDYPNVHYWLSKSSGREISKTLAVSRLGYSGTESSLKMKAKLYKNVFKMFAQRFLYPHNVESPG